MSKHTPGPWEASVPYILNDTGLPIAEVFAGRSLRGELNYKANARLMAAAPEMYDALRDLYSASVLQSIPFDTAWQKAISLYEELTAKIEGDV